METLCQALKKQGHFRNKLNYSKSGLSRKKLFVKERFLPNWPTRNDTTQKTDDQQ
jgi:hypothetical protein